MGFLSFSDSKGELARKAVISAGVEMTYVGEIAGFDVIPIEEHSGVCPKQGLQAGVLKQQRCYARVGE